MSSEFDLGVRIQALTLHSQGLRSRLRGIECEREWQKYWRLGKVCVGLVTVPS